MTKTVAHTDRQPNLPSMGRGLTKAIRDAIGRAQDGDIIRIKVKNSRVIPSIRTIATRTCAELGVIVTTRASEENSIDISIKHNQSVH